MKTRSVLLLLGGLAIAVLALWYFLASGRDVQDSVGSDGVREIRVKVDSGYSPERIVARQGVPLRLIFQRGEEDHCTGKVDLPDFGISSDLPPSQTTSIEFTPDKAGEFIFNCGMKMVRGKLVIEPAAAK